MITAYGRVLTERNLPDFMYSLETGRSLLVLQKGAYTDYTDVIETQFDFSREMRRFKADKEHAETTDYVLPDEFEVSFALVAAGLRALSKDGDFYFLQFSEREIANVLGETYLLAGIAYPYKGISDGISERANRDASMIWGGTVQMTRFERAWTYATEELRLPVWGAMRVALLAVYQGYIRDPRVAEIAEEYKVARARQARIDADMDAARKEADPDGTNPRNGEAAAFHALISELSKMQGNKNLSE